jgi:hypothetical protein
MSLLGELNFFFGIHISHLKEGIFISQTNYIKEMLKKIGMEDCKPVSTPMVTGCKLRKVDEYKDVDHRLYRFMIGSLLYVISSRLDVMQAVGHVAIFQVALKETHVMAVKRIFRYLKETTEFVLWYIKCNELNMVSYTDSYWEGSIDDIRSTSAVSFYLGDCLVSWLNKNQFLVSLFTTEENYIAITTFSFIWMNKTLKYIQLKYDEAISIFYDNTSAISISKNPMMHSNTKYISMRLELVNRGLVSPSNWC